MLPQRDIFSLADEAVLRGLPRLRLAKKEPNFDTCRRALKEGCTWLATNHTKPGSAIRESISKLLGRTNDTDGLSLEASTALHGALLTLDESDSLTAPARAQAWWMVLISWMRVHREHHARVQRLLLAALAVPPTSEKEVSEWLVAKRLVPVEAEIGLPVRTVGGF